MVFLINLKDFVSAEEIKSNYGFKQIAYNLKDYSLLNKLKNELAKEIYNLRVGEYSKYEYISSTLKIYGITKSSYPDIFKRIISYFTKTKITAISSDQLNKILLGIFPENNIYSKEIQNKIIKILKDIVKCWKKNIEKCFTKDYSQKKGQLSEIIFSMIFRDFFQCSYIFDKINLDNPNISRPGIDLIGINFGSNEEEDRVFLVEIKGTEDSAYTQIYKIVDWFNHHINDRLFYDFEQLKRRYRHNFGIDVKYNRLVNLLTKIINSWNIDFNVISNCFFNGCLTYDSNINSKELKRAIQYFSNLEFSSELLILNIFKIEKLKNFTEEVFLLAANN